MTQAVANTLNNLEQMISSQSNLQKVSGDTISAMDKTQDFTKVFESTLNKEISTIDDVKLKTSQESAEIKDDTIISIEFKEILQEATDEANIETSLDLTLAKDINEIITELKEAVENTSEIIEDFSSEDSVVIVDEFLNNEEGLDVEIENKEQDDVQVQTQDLNSQEQKISFEQVLTFSDKSLLNVDIKDNVMQAEEENLNVSQELIDFSSDEVIELVENVFDEAVSVNKTVEEQSYGDFEIALDEEMLKELNIESISAQNDSSSGESFMQNQTPEEHAVKAIINQEVEIFELKIDSNKNIEITQQVQSKPVEINPSKILDQISKQLEGLQNNSKVNIVLNPESLGKVNVQLMSTKEGITAQFIVTTQEAKDLISKGLDGLKEALGNHGVAFDNVSVRVADTQKAEYKQDWTEQEGSRGGNKGQGQPNREEKEKGLFEKMMAQTIEEENGNV